MKQPDTADEKSPATATGARVGKAKSKSAEKIPLEESVLEMEEGIEQDKPPHITGRRLNAVLVIIAFSVLFGYLFIAGEGTKTLEAIQQFNYWFLLAALGGMIVYWVLESVCMQLLVNQLHKGFSFLKTNIVTIIGQYFNGITPLSSGGQPMQAYYYRRLGLPLSDAMTMLLCRFIVYQTTVTLYSVVVLVLRFGYFTQHLAALMALVIVGFVGGVGLVAALLALAFARKTTTRFVVWGIGFLARIHIIKHPEQVKLRALHSMREAYDGVTFLLSSPKLLFQVAGVTVVQLTVFFSVSYIIYLGFGETGSDIVTVISCQAFVYMISSFVPLPGAMGAAEGSYVAFFSFVYSNSSLVALSTFVWRIFTFYLPIVLGMGLTVLVNNPHSLLSRYLARKDSESGYIPAGEGE